MRKIESKQRKLGKGFIDSRIRLNKPLFSGNLYITDISTWKTNIEPKVSIYNLVTEVLCSS